MDAVMLERVQFAVTIGYHFLFAPLTIGLSWLNVWLMTRCWRTCDAADRYLTRFWIKIFALSFAVGVATGITMEFQFGTNWAAYAKFVGDIFGPLLAAEVIFAFFLESTFIAVLLVGWNRLSPRALWFASLMVAVGSTMSAFWILAANSWMQTPAGYALVNGHPVLTSFWQATFNPSTLPRFLHTVIAALMTGAFFMAGISAWFLLKGRHAQAFQRTLFVSLLTAFIASLLQLGSGHNHAEQVYKTQPVKLAAIEGLFNSQRHAPLMIIGIIDSRRQTVHPAIRLPGGLSLFTEQDANALIRGLDTAPPSQWPPLVLTFYPFHFMVLIGMFLVAFSALGLLLAWLGKLYHNRLFLLAAVLSIPLPLLANELGWMTAEVGRQPWIVYNIMRTRDAVSANVSAGNVLFSLLALGLFYTVISIFWVVAMRRELRRGLVDSDTAEKEDKSS